MTTRYLTLHRLAQSLGVTRTAAQTAIVHGKLTPAAVLVVPTGEQPLFLESQVGDLVRALQPPRKRAIE